MALLVMRVAGDRHGRFYYPHLAGVGHSKNLYVCSNTTGENKGMLRLVLGLGTRAVDREADDYARLLSLDNPTAPLKVAHGVPAAGQGTFTDLLARSKEERKTYVVQKPARDAQEAVLDYETLGTAEGLSLVEIHLRTGRTHQIRCQFSHRGLPLVGDRKYSTLPDDCAIALWSHRLAFRHPVTGAPMEFSAYPPDVYPWNLFA